MRPECDAVPDVGLASWPPCPTSRLSTPSDVTTTDAFGRGAELDEVIERITVDAYGDEPYWCFLQAFTDEVDFPLESTVVGTPVRVIGVDFDGDERRGLVAVVENERGRYRVSILDVTIEPLDQHAAALVAAYCRWLGVDG